MDEWDILTARFDICTLKSRHLRLLDTQDWAGFAGMLTEDFVLDVSAAAPGVPVIAGRDAAVAMVQAQMAGVRTVHQAHQPQFDFDGDKVRIVWAMQDRLISGTTLPSMRGYGQHHDCWLRRDGTWKLAAQRLTRRGVEILAPAMPANA